MIFIDPFLLKHSLILHIIFIEYLIDSIFITKEHLGKMFNFSLKIALFLLKTYSYRIVLVQIRDQGPKIDPCAKFSQIRQKIREVEFRSSTISKTAWWHQRNVYCFWKLLLQTAIMPSLVVIRPQIKEKQRWGHILFTKIA